MLFTPEHDKERLVEILNSTRNRCEVCVLLCSMPDKEYLLSTILEDMCADITALVDDYCR